eukprot:TRINITY_DN8897_c0_g1_i2.p1 TRINITY_DN8897_c0_g1~~TRINITY_DN8897_c0_g1_i2.p1  ORF type:complete len:255 (-),score=45.73 TRINITY_DN8897_c0_g1_i2:9-773(-)
MRCSRRQLKEKEPEIRTRRRCARGRGTGGTSIEDCTYREENDDDHWGHHNEFLKHWDGGKGIFNCAAQHVPMSAVQHLYGVGKDSYFANKETFCAVRDPYDRVISAFSFNGRGDKWTATACSPEQLNKEVVWRLKKMEKNPLQEDCHWLPQVWYVKGVKMVDNGQWKVDLKQQNCKHILRFEHLVEEFNSLMQTKGYAYRMHQRSQKGSASAGSTTSSANCTKLTKRDLEPETRRMLEQFYKDDFDALSYERLP